jgi:hypothetical protein
MTYDICMYVGKKLSESSIFDAESHGFADSQGRVLETIGHCCQPLRRRSSAMKNQGVLTKRIYKWWNFLHLNGKTGEITGGYVRNRFCGHWLKLIKLSIFWLSRVEMSFVAIKWPV